MCVSRSCPPLVQCEAAVMPSGQNACAQTRCLDITCMKRRALSWQRQHLSEESKQCIRLMRNKNGKLSQCARSIHTSGLWVGPLTESPQCCDRKVQLQLASESLRKAQRVQMCGQRGHWASVDTSAPCSKCCGRSFECMTTEIK
eukprot:scaffold59452_cov26-Tisochrysis_lutea.AAC.1